ncbi:unnamed protein product, partial [Ectocarpus fasciculatus]
MSSRPQPPRLSLCTECTTLSGRLCLSSRSAHTGMTAWRQQAVYDLRSLHARHQAQRPLEGVRGKDQEQHLVVKGWTTQTESPRAC